MPLGRGFMRAGFVTPRGRLLLVSAVASDAADARDVEGRPHERRACDARWLCVALQRPTDMQILRRGLEDTAD